MRVHDSLRVALGLLACGVFAGACLAQQGLAERAGQALDGVGRGLRRGTLEVTDAVRKRFEVIREDVGKMGVGSRVYSRLHWDKTLNGSKIEVHMLRDGSVLLRGYVPDEAARKHAVVLASETMDVAGVVDELVPLATTKRPARTVQPR